MQNFIKTHVFLGKLFPEGLDCNDVFVGGIQLKGTGSAVLSIHARSKPSISVKKWGVWGIDYNIIVIDLVLSDILSLNISNWGNSSWCMMREKSDSYEKKLWFEKNNFSLEVIYEYIIFQECRVYKNSD